MAAHSDRPVPLRSVARPKQARSERTLRRLLDAAEALIAERGGADLTVPELVHRAGSSVGGFYARFRDKDELLQALEERFFHELDARVAELSRPERWEGASIPEIVADLVGELVRTVREREALLRCILIRAARDRDTLEEGLRFRRRVSERVSALLLPRREQIGHPDPGLAVDLGVQLLFGLAQQAATLGEVRVGDRVLSDADLAREFARNFLAYLDVRGSDAHHARA